MAEIPFARLDELNQTWEDIEAALLATQSAQQAAETAEQNAETAEQNAETAEQGAVAAQGLAEAAQLAAEGAQQAAETAQQNAETAETNAETAETNAEAAQLAAENARDAALQAKTDAETAKTNAETAETNAEAAQLAAENARDAALQAKTDAETAETNAETAETNAEAAQLAAENARDAALIAQSAAEAAADNFDDVYLGSKSGDPTLDNDGGALVEGQLYWNTSSNSLKIYDGSSWVSYNPTAGVTGPASSVDDNIATFNGTSGEDIQDSGVSINDVLVSSDIGTSIQGYDADTAKLDTAQTWTAVQTFQKEIVIQAAREKVTRVGSAATGTINFDALTQGILHYTTAASGEFTLNFRGDGSTTLNSLMSTSQIWSFLFKAKQGSPAYSLVNVTVDGSAVDELMWVDGEEPTGTISGLDEYLISIEKTADATFSVEVIKTSFAEAA